MWPMVPTFTCGLLRSNFSLAMSAILALRSCDGADVQDRTGDLVLTKDALCQLSYIGKQSQSFSLSVSVWSGRRGSNPRPTAWKAVTLPLSYSRLRGSPPDASSPLRRGKPALPPRSPLPRARRPFLQILALFDSFCWLASRSPRLRCVLSRRSCGRAKAGGEGRIRTSEGLGRQIYSLLRLTASLPRRDAASTFQGRLQTSTTDGWKLGVFVRNCAAREFSGEFVGAGEGI